jgi:hypothetical protein
MGDYSSTFTIRNELPVDMHLDNHNVVHGYWFHAPQAVINAHTESGPMQIKDYPGSFG